MILPLDFTNVITNMPIPACNYIHALDLPSNVEVYVSDQRETTLRNKKPLRHNSILTLKKGSIVQEPKEVFLTTVGTSEEKGRLQLESINQKQYWEINQQDNQSIDLRSDVTDSLLVLQNLDKIINPFHEELLFNFKGSEVTAFTTIFETLSCDFDELEILGSIQNSAFASSHINITIDDTTVYAPFIVYGSSLHYGNDGEFCQTVKHLRGRKLNISYAGIAFAQFTKKTRKV